MPRRSQEHRGPPTAEPFETAADLVQIGRPRTLDAKGSIEAHQEHLNIGRNAAFQKPEDLPEHRLPVGLL